MKMALYPGWKPGGQILCAAVAHHAVTARDQNLPLDGADPGLRFGLADEGGAHECERLLIEGELVEDSTVPPHEGIHR